MAFSDVFTLSQFGFLTALSEEISPNLHELVLINFWILLRTVASETDDINMTLGSKMTTEERCIPQSSHSVVSCAVRAAD